jgi:hypothetical protein
MKDDACPECHSPLASADAFCRRCGHALPGRVVDPLVRRSRRALLIGIASVLLPPLVVIVARAATQSISDVSTAMWIALLVPGVNWIAMLVALLR